MFEPSISVSSENANITRLPKDSKSNQSKGLKKRSKALSDVKNTLHSHSSTVAEKSKNLSKNAKNGENFSSIGKKKKSCESKTGFNIFETKKDAENKFHSGFECHNHFACEKANALNEAEFLAEYKLKKKEINYLGNRMRFCQLETIPFKAGKIEAAEDVEIPDMRKAWSDDIEDELVSFEIPEPSFF